MTMTINSKHNMPPPFDDAEAERLQKRLSELTAEKSKIPKAINDDTTAEQVKDRRDAAKALASEIENVRKVQKDPHLEAGRTVDRVFNNLKDKAIAIADDWHAPLDAYITRKDDERRVAEAKARREAEEAERAAKKARREAEEAEARQAEQDAAPSPEEQARLDEEARDAETRAAEAKEAADRAAKAKTQVRSGSGLGRTSGVKTTYHVTVTKPVLTFPRYKNDPDVIEALRKCAEREVRANKGQNPGIAGIEIKEERKIA